MDWLTAAAGRYRIAAVQTHKFKQRWRPDWWTTQPISNTCDLGPLLGVAES